MFLLDIRNLGQCRSDDLEQYNLTQKSGSDTFLTIEMMNLQRAMYTMGTPKHNARSINMRLRLSSYVIRAIRTDATRSRCILRQKHAAGRAIFEPMSILVTVRPSQSHEDAFSQDERGSTHRCHTTLTSVQLRRSSKIWCSPPI